MYLRALRAVKTKKIGVHDRTGLETKAALHSSIHFGRAVVSRPVLSCTPIFFVFTARKARRYISFPSGVRVGYMPRGPNHLSSRCSVSTMTRRAGDQS